MRVHRKLIEAVLVGLLFSISSVGISAEWTKGEIRKMDMDNKRLTIKHEEIRNLDMPPMTMVFRVRDTGLIAAYKVGDLIQFQAEMDGKNYVLTAIQKEQ